MDDRWRRRLEMGLAMVALCRARLLIEFVRFDRWKDSLGTAPQSPNLVRDDKYAAVEGLRLAGRVDRAAQRIPVAIKCLPRAMALSWLLRRSRINHALVFAVRPQANRDTEDYLHAWVEIDGRKIIGDLPGPWIETLRLGD